MNLTTSNIVTQAAQSPFHFNSAAYLLRIERERAGNPGELLEALRTCPEDSIFQHTFRTLQEHHFIRGGYSNDFLHWAKKYVDCQLVLAGGGASDDPEGAAVLKEVMEAQAMITTASFLNLPPWSALEIKCLTARFHADCAEIPARGFRSACDRGALER